MSLNGITRRTFATSAFSMLAILGTGALLGTPAYADYSASAETEAALSDAQTRYENALAQIDYLNDQYFDAEAQYNYILDQINDTQAQIDQLQADIEAKQAELSQAQDILYDRVAASYRAGNVELIDVLLQATDFDDFVSRLYYANKTSDADAEAIQAVKDIKASLEADQQALYEHQAQLEDLRAQQEAALDELSVRLAAAQDYAASLDSEVQALIAQRDAEIAAAAEAARIAAEQEAERQRQEQAAQGGSSSGDSGSSSDSGDSGPSDSGSGGSDAGGSSSGGTGVHDSSVVSAAYSLIGTPYGTLDCSGLTSAAYGACGYSLYHQSGVQYSIVAGKGNLVGADGLVAGDLVFYARGGSIYHVGLYIGDGYIIDSIPSGGVQVRTLYFCDGFCGGGSPL